MKPIVITDVDDEQNFISFALPNGQVVKVLRMDYVDEDTFDAINEDLVKLDVEEQLVAVANDIAASPVGTKLKWQPLLDEAKAKLVSLGVDVVRVVDEDGRRDEVSVDSVDVVEALKPYSDRKPRPLRKRSRDIALTMLKHVLSEEQAAMFENMRLGQLEKLVGEWRKNSTVTLGE